MQSYDVNSPLVLTSQASSVDRRFCGPRLFPASDRHLFARAVAFITTLLSMFSLFAGRLSGADGDLRYIQRIDIVSLSHLDVGFTDFPSTVHEYQRRYIDVAIDLAWETRDRVPEERFHWTAESALPVAEWWQHATQARRDRLVALVKDGQIDVGGFSFSVESFADAQEWAQMLHWLPPDAWEQLRPRVGIQDDVNGLARAGAMQLLDSGIDRIFMGLNRGGGGPPFPAPAPFWWIMPDGRKVFVYLAKGYFNVQGIFGLWDWRRGPTPRSYELMYRPPRKDEILASDEKSVRMLHDKAIVALQRIESDGYHYPRLISAFSNVWRADDDPPFPYLPDFVATWRRLGLKPELRLATASQAVESLQNEVGATAPSYHGDWPDWWDNGPTSGPRELAADRAAKRNLAALNSPVWEDITSRVSRAVEEIRRDLCLFEEHTGGSAWSTAFPDELDSEAQRVEKVALSYRAKERSAWLLSQRARTLLYPKAEGLYVVNPTAAPLSGWVTFPGPGLREDYHSVRDRLSGLVHSIQFRPGVQMERPKQPSDLTPENSIAVYADHMPNAVARFWVENVPPNSFRAFALEKQAVAESSKAVFTATLDAGGWPTSIRWPGMNKPLFTGEIGEVTSVKVQGFSPRWIAMDMLDLSDRNTIDAMRSKHLVTAASQAGEQTMEERSAHSTTYTQHLKLPGMQWMIRRLEVWNDTPRARLTLRFNRAASTDPEVLFASFSVPATTTLPTVSNGGVPFTAYQDQLPGTCRDYFAIDGWASYSTGDGNWLWISRDAPVVTFGDTHVLEKLTATPPNTHRILSMMFNSIWFTNWYADSPGVMEFQYDLVWNKDKYNDPASVANALETDPVVLINPAQREHPVILEDLFKP